MKDIPGTRELNWLASDSWGAKRVPVDGQESLAEGAVTILPQRQVLKGRENGTDFLLQDNHHRYISA